jgi:hypothetical protein
VGQLVLAISNFLSFSCLFMFVAPCAELSVWAVCSRVQCVEVHTLIRSLHCIAAHSGGPLCENGECFESVVVS